MLGIVARTVARIAFSRQSPRVAQRDDNKQARSEQKRSEHDVQGVLTSHNAAEGDKTLAYRVRYQALEEKKLKKGTQSEKKRSKLNVPRENKRTVSYAAATRAKPKN